MAIDIATLTQQVKHNMAEAPATAAQLGTAATPTLIELSKDENPDVRLSALICLQVTGGVGAADAAMERLDDEDEEVQAQALQVLYAHPPHGKGKELLARFQKSTDSFEKERLALIAGKLAPDVNMLSWKQTWQAEKKSAAHSTVENNLLAAVARMGDSDARIEFARRLPHFDATETDEWLGLCEYMEDRSVISIMLPLLDRNEVAYDLAPDMPDTLPQRVSDLTVKAIIKISGASVAFPVKRVTQFTAPEINTVRMIAQQAPPFR